MDNQSLFDFAQNANFETLTVTREIRAVSLFDGVFIAGLWALLVWLLYAMKTDRIKIEGLENSKKEKFLKRFEVFVLWVYPIAVIAAIVVKIFMFMQASGG